METYTFEAGSNWNHAIKVRLNELYLDYDEFPERGKSTFVIRMWSDQDFEHVELLVEQIELTMKERAQARAAWKAQVEAKQKAQRLARANFFRKLTFRKTLTTLPQG
jgi:hypothetical protein